MTQRELITQAYIKLQSYAEVGRIFKLSHQRIHQIVTGYSTITYKGKGKWGKSKQLKKLSQQGCYQCGVNVEVFHHKDGNSKNNDIINLLPSCKIHHYKLHKGTFYKSVYSNKKCKGWCNRILTTTIHEAKGYCHSCYQYFFKNKIPKNITKYRRLSSCLGCSKLFTEIEYVAKNRCRKCYNKYLFTPEEWNLYCKLRFKRRYANDPEFRKKRLEYNRRNRIRYYKKKPRPVFSI